MYYNILKQKFREYIKLNKTPQRLDCNARDFSILQNDKNSKKYLKLIKNQSLLNMGFTAKLEIDGKVLKVFVNSSYQEWAFV